MRSLDNLGVDRIDLLQFHVWEDRWAADPSWQRVVEQLKEDGLIGGFGLSVNRWEPTNCLAALDTGLVDAVQVIYNVFDQAPEDELFGRCQADGIAVIVRVPYDEGSLTGTLTAGQPLAGGRLPEHLLRPGEPGADRGPGRGAAEGRAGRDDAARAGAAVRARAPGGERGDPGHAHRRRTYGPTWPPATRRRSTPACSTSCARTAGTALPRPGPDEP